MQLNAAARAAFDAMSEGVTIIDIEGKIVFGNRAYRSFLNKEAGGDIGEIEGYRLRDLRPAPVCRRCWRRESPFFTLPARRSRISILSTCTRFIRMACW